MDKVVDLLDKILTKLGVTGGKVWPYLVQHEFMIAMMGIVFSIIFILVGVNMFVWGIKNKNKYGDIPVAISVVGSLVLLLGLAVMCVNIPNAVYPEVAAIYSVIKHIGGK